MAKLVVVFLMSSSATWLGANVFLCFPSLPDFWCTLDLLLCLSSCLCLHTVDWILLRIQNMTSPCHLIWTLNLLDLSYPQRNANRHLYPHLVLWLEKTLWGSITSGAKKSLCYPEISCPDPLFCWSTCQWAAQLVSSLITLYYHQGAEKWREAETREKWVMLLGVRARRKWWQEDFNRFYQFTEHIDLDFL